MLLKGAMSGRHALKRWCLAEERYGESPECAVQAARRNVETPQGIQVPCEPLELSTTGHLVV